MKLTITLLSIKENSSEGVALWKDEFLSVFEQDRNPLEY